MSKKTEKLLGGAQEHFEPGEKVLAAVDGTYETTFMGKDGFTRTGVLVATDRRVVFYAKKVGGYDLETFPYRSISSVEVSKGMTGNRISFFATGNKVAMKYVSDATALAAVVQEIKTRQHGPEAATTPSAPPPGEPDVIDQIRRLGELRDAGVLSSEEFEAKKAELLGRL